MPAAFFLPAGLQWPDRAAGGRGLSAITPQCRITVTGCALRSRHLAPKDWPSCSNRRSLTCSPKRKGSTRLQEPQKAADLYKTWIARNGSNQLLHAVYFNYGGGAVEGRATSAGAINALRECIRLKPDFYPPYINLGRALEDTGQPGVGGDGSGWRWSTACRRQRRRRQAQADGAAAARAACSEGAHRTAPRKTR